MSFNFLLPGEAPPPSKPPPPPPSKAPPLVATQQPVILKPVINPAHQALPPPKGLSESDAQLYMRLCEIRKLTNIHASSGAEFLEGMSEPSRGPSRLFRRKKKRPQAVSKEEVMQAFFLENSDTEKSKDWKTQFFSKLILKI